MPSFRVPFTIEGTVEISADNEAHAHHITREWTNEQWIKKGECERTVHDAEELPSDEEGMLADHYWDRMQERENA